MKTKFKTTKQIAEFLNGELVGEGDLKIYGPEELSRAESHHITFIGNSKYASMWKESAARAAIVSKSLKVEAGPKKALIRVGDADIAMAKILEIFAPALPEIQSSNKNCTIHESASIDKNAKIGEGSYIGQNVKIGKDVLIYPNVTILDDSSIGEGTIIWPGTVIRERSIIGRYCILHNNVSIGADGFGFRPSLDGRGIVKIPQIGNVVIGDYVEIGANSCIDRGKFSSTILGDGCKIDNLVQIGHNSILGRFCIMAGNSGLAGSVTLGDGVMIGGSASIKDHTNIGAGAKIGAGSGVIGDVPAGATYLGYPAQEARFMLKQWVALKKLIRN